MKRLAIRTVEIKNLGLPGDWLARIASARVKAKAADLTATPILQMPGVQAGTMRVIYGADRLAAMAVAGQTHAEVQVWEATDAEAARARIVENLHRRNDNQDALKAALVDLEHGQAIATAKAEEAEREAQEADNPAQAFTTQEVITEQPVPKLPTAAKPGRPKGERSKARERVAADAGTTPAAIKQAEVRAKKKAQPKPAGIPGFDDFDLPVSYADRMEALVSALDSADQQFRGVVSRLNAAAAAVATDAGPGLGATVETWRALRDRAVELGKEVRRLRPRAVCPYCKAVPGEVENCGSCRGCGYATGERMQGVPPELLGRGEAAAIYVGGELVKLPDVPAAQQRAKRGRR